MCFLISSAKIVHFPRTAKQIADYFRENANVKFPIRSATAILLAPPRRKASRRGG